MRCIVLRDDDTNALTPVECLETLYRPFLDRGLPVNLATIPEVRVNARTPDGRREGFLPRDANVTAETVPLAENRALTSYLHANPGFHVVQHGCYHDTFEFDRVDRADVVRRLNRGRERLKEAGLGEPETFVAPHDRLSRVAFSEVARRFRIVSTGWFELGRLPVTWWPRYLAKKVLRRAHWRVGATRLLSHPGCLLSYHRAPESILPAIKRAIAAQDVTVLVTHWWEYFHEGTPNEPFIRALHETAEYLASDRSLVVVPFRALLAKDPIAEGGVRPGPAPVALTR